MHRRTNHQHIGTVQLLDQRFGSGDRACLCDIGGRLLGNRVRLVDRGQRVTTDHPLDHGCRWMGLQQKANDVFRQPIAFGRFAARAASNVEDFHDSPGLNCVEGIIL
ncbi:hypothetical protein D3C76_1634290 [compost metagenome]